jgi:hypothetical protein
MADFAVVNHGTLYVLHPLTPAARAWINQNIDSSALRFGPNGIAIEHRYIADIMDGMKRDGLVQQ